MFVRGDDATILHADLDAFYASVEQRDDPAPAGPARHRRRRGRAGGELRGPGLRRAHGDGRPPGPGPLPGGRRGRTAHVGVLGGEQGGLRGLRATPPRSSRACRSTRRSSTWAACGGSRARRPRSPCGCGGTVLERVGLPITVGVATDQVPRQGGERGGQARRPAGGAARSGAGLPAPAGRRTALGGGRRDRRTSSATRGIATVGEVAALDEAALVSMLGRGSGRHLHALAHNRDPRPVEVGPPAALDRIAAGARPGADRRRSRRRRARRPRRPGHAAGCAGRAGSGAPSCCACASTTSPGRPARTPCRGRRRRPRRSSRRCGTAGRRGDAADRGARASPWSASPSPTWTTSDAVQLALPFDRRRDGALDAALDEVRDRFGSAAVTRVVLLGQDHGPSVPLLPD